MKYLIKCFFILFWANSFGQKKTVVSGTIKSQDNFLVHIYEPINGYYNTPFLDSSKTNSILINGTDSFYRVLDIQKPSFIKIYFTGEDKIFKTLSDLLIFPGDSLHVAFDINFDSTNSATYSGSNAAAQKLFNEINFQPYNKFIPVHDLLENLNLNKNTLIKDLDTIAFALRKKFDSLQINGKCTQLYVDYVDITFKTLIYNEIIKKFLGSYKKKEVIPKSLRDSIIATLFLQQPPTDKRLNSLYLSPFYIKNYYNYLTYKKFNLNSIEPITKEDRDYTINKNKYLVKSDFVPFLYIKDEVEKQNLWALEILLFYKHLPGKYDESEITQFNSVFPNNKWESLLKSQFENYKVTKKIEYKLLNPIHYIDTSNNISNIGEMISKLPKGKPMFVDIWATWCGPCISAFAYNKQLDSFLLLNNIEKLYISIDDFQDNLKWKKAIEKYALGGYHILAGEYLLSDIKTSIYNVKKNEGMPIPRYILIDKYGKIVNDDAYPPHDFILLKEQITKYLLQ